MWRRKNGSRGNPRKTPTQAAAPFLLKLFRRQPASPVELVLHRGSMTSCSAALHFIRSTPFTQPFPLATTAFHHQRPISPSSVVFFADQSTQTSTLLCHIVVSSGPPWFLFYFQDHSVDLVTLGSGLHFLVGIDWLVVLDFLFCFYD